MSLQNWIADDLRVDPEYIRIISKRNYLYTQYCINGRVILHPSKQLKILQKWLAKNIFNKYPISKYSMAYSKGDSVKKNAFKHRNANYILHMDIKHFFPSITRSMLKDFLTRNNKITKKLELTNEDIDLLLNICLYRGQTLVVGSVASPIVANILMYDFDQELNDSISRFGRYCYTRYADDIVISSKNYIPQDLIYIVSDMIEKFGFQVNNKKTYFMNKSGKRQVTGVVIDNNKNKLTIGEKRYKSFKRQLYQYLVKGKGDITYILGYLSYIRDINANQYKQLEKIYKKYDKEGQIFK